MSAPLFGIFDARKISRVSQNPLPRGQEEQRYVFPETIRDLLPLYGLQDFGINRPNLKHNGNSIGREGAGNIMHANLRPADPYTKLEDFTWPPYFNLTAGSGATYKENYAMTYKIDDKGPLTGIICLRNAPCHLPFRPKGEGGEFCLCENDDRNREEKAKNTYLNPKKTQVDFATAFGFTKDKTECPHYEAGKCKHHGEGKCGFDHSFSKLKPADIECKFQHSNGPNAQCTFGRACRYNHTWKSAPASKRPAPTVAPSGQDANMTAAQQCKHYISIRPYCTHYISNIVSRPISRKRKRRAYVHLMQVACSMYVSIANIGANLHRTSIGLHNPCMAPSPFAHNYTPTRLAGINVRGLRTGGRLYLLRE